MKPTRLIAILFMIGVLGAIIAVPVMLIAGMQNGVSAFKNANITIDSDWVGSKVKPGKNALTSEISSISQEGFADVEWIPSKESYFIVEGKAENFKYIKYEIDGSQLKLGSKKARVKEMDHTVQITVFSPTLEDYNLAGKGNFTANELRGQKFSLNLAGTGDVSLRGNLEDLEFNVAGKGNINAAGLVTRNASVSIAGNSNIELNAYKSIEASVVGSGVIRYKGNPEIDKTIIGKCEFVKAE